MFNFIFLTVLGVAGEKPQQSEELIGDGENLSRWFANHSTINQQHHLQVLGRSKNLREFS